MRNHDDDFNLVNLPVEAQDPEITKEDFVLQDSDKAVHEQKFQTKPTTFFKDSLKRFAKNKSSVVAAGILGILVLLALIVPEVSPYDVSTTQDAALANLEPKLFENANGFWDGTEYLTHVPIDQSTMMPDPEVYEESGIKGGQAGIKYTDQIYTSNANRFGTGGYALVGYYGIKEATYGQLKSSNPKDYTLDLKEKKFVLDLNISTLTLTDFVAADLDMIHEIEGDDSLTLPDGFVIGKTTLQFHYYNEEEKKFTPVPLLEPSTTQNIGRGSDPVNISSIIKRETGISRFSNFYFTITVLPTEETKPDDSVCGLVQKMVIYDSARDIPFIPTEEQKTNPYQNEIDYFSIDLGGRMNGICFDNAMTFIARDKTYGTGMDTKTNRGYWTIINRDQYVKGVHLGKSVYGSFTFDGYSATLGKRNIDLPVNKLNYYQSKKWIAYKVVLNEEGTDIIDFKFSIRNKAKSPIYENITLDDVFNFSISPSGAPIFSVHAKVHYYKYLGFDEMPKFLFGTDKGGRDMFKYVFEGLRNSLLLGVMTFAICFLFGLLWGAISGYFGGTVDLVMERITDILSGMPWIVVMTLVILHLGSNMTTFLIALCLTGWIGTASTTRTQFYRFRGREYVLASRTLGASDARLIAKHILPNAMGTIITGAVLMIPSVIFSEATISYLGLGFQNMSSLGVILSANQAELFNHPYQLIFPSVVIALVMISFNLFGNGLRDAINPSLKGEGE